MSITVTIEQSESGWTLQCHHLWDDYRGEMRTDAQTTLMRALLEAKPKLLMTAWGKHTTKLVDNIILVTIPFPDLDEAIAVRLNLVPQKDTERTIKVLQTSSDRLLEQIDELDNRVEEICDRVKDLEKPGRTGLLAITNIGSVVPMDKLRTFAREFSKEYQEFRKSLVNTTEEEAFNKWQTSLGPLAMGIYAEYIARVRRLSLHTPLSTNGGLFSRGCWTTRAVVPGSITPEMHIVGPCTAIATQYFECIEIEPLPDATKTRLGLD